MFTRLVSTLMILAGPIHAAKAGLYDPATPKLDLPTSPGLTALPFDTYRFRLSDMMVVGLATPETKPRLEAIATRDRLLASTAPADLVVRGIVRFRLREIDAALGDWQQAYRRNPRDFWAISALGTGYLATGQASEAARYLEVAAELMPADWPDRDAAALVESSLLKLARLRAREQLVRTGRRPPESTDDLFGVVFTDSGLSEADKAKLPANAIAIVQQLLLWMPDDARLYWLLGELYYAAGDIDSAATIFGECVDSRRLDARALRERRKAVLDAIAARPVPKVPDWKPSETRWWLVAVVAGPIVLLLTWLQVRQIARRLR